MYQHFHYWMFIIIAMISLQCMCTESKSNKRHIYINIFFFIYKRILGYLVGLKFYRWGMIWYMPEKIRCAADEWKYRFAKQNTRRNFIHILSSKYMVDISIWSLNILSFLISNDYTWTEIAINKFRPWL